MSVLSDTNKSDVYNCNGSVTEFSGPFPILDEDHISVILTDADGNETILTKTTHYSVTPTGGSYPATTFTVTTVETYASGNTIVILRSVPTKQLTNYGKSGAYLPENHETSFDYLTMKVQEMEEILTRSVRYGPSVDLSGVTILLDEAGQVILSYLQPDSVTTQIVADKAITYPKIQDVTLSDRILGRASAGPGQIEEILCTEAGRNLIDDFTVAAQRTTLGLGTMATQNLSAVDIDGGTIDGVAITGGSISGVTIDGSLNTNNLLYIEDQKSVGTDGGTSTAGSWQTRELNTLVVDNIVGASLATNQITLPAGTYWIEGEAPIYSGVLAQTKLRNITDGSDAIIGDSRSYSNGHANTPPAKFKGPLTIAASKTFELQARVQIGFATVGFGKAAGYTTEVYSRIKIWKVA